MIGDKIKSLREARSLTQAQMAEKTGINVNTLASYERNIREPRIEVITQLCNFFGVSSDFLLGLSPYPNTEQCVAIDEKFSALPVKMRLKFSETQIALLRAADTFGWAAEQVSVIDDLFDYLSDDLKKCIDAYIQLVDGNTPETNWKTSPSFFVDQFLYDRAQMTQNVSKVIDYIYRHRQISVTEMREKAHGDTWEDFTWKKVEEGLHGIDQETDD